jgi:hypothetical protein
MVERQELKCATHRSLFGLFELGGVAMNLESMTVRDPVEIKAVLSRCERMQFSLGAKGLRNL